MSSFSFVRAIGVVVAVMAMAGVARAEDQCPVGSIERTEASFTWCEPSVCDTDAQCATGSICRGVPLCVEVGALDAGKGEAGGARLMARQRCGENKSCPQNTTCSDKSRCMTLAQADKAGLNTKSGPSAAASAAPSGDAPKKACGCDMPGTRGGELAGGVLAMLGLVVIGVRRRARR
jgi:hypothetical protein